ncbi:MAG: AraC family transcriptional regulator N-terminal domain-containing protein [Bacillota bacterium]
MSVRWRRDLLDATLWLARLTAKPSDHRALVPLVIREIVYWLMTGAQGARLCHLTTFGGQTHWIVRAAANWRENFQKPRGESRTWRRNWT